MDKYQNCEDFFLPFVLDECRQNIKITRRICLPLILDECRKNIKITKSPIFLDECTHSLAFHDNYYVIMIEI